MKPDNLLSLSFSFFHHFQYFFQCHLRTIVNRTRFFTNTEKFRVHK